MKARRKSDGEIIKVEAIVYNAKSGERYSPSELDFNVDSEEIVIQGWVGRDQDGYVSLFKNKPIRDTCDKDDMPYGFWDDVDGNCIDLPITSFPDITWESEPLDVEIIIKRKKK